MQRLDPLAVLLQIGVTGGRIRALGQNIHLDLGLGTGGAHHNGAITFQQELEHIGLRQTVQTQRITYQSGYQLTVRIRLPCF